MPSAGFLTPAWTCSLRRFLTQWRQRTPFLQPWRDFHPMRSHLRREGPELKAIINKNLAALIAAWSADSTCIDRDCRKAWVLPQKYCSCNKIKRFTFSFYASFLQKKSCKNFLAADEKQLYFYSQPVFFHQLSSAVSPDFPDGTKSFLCSENCIYLFIYCIFFLISLKFRSLCIISVPVYKNVFREGEYLMWFLHLSLWQHDSTSPESRSSSHISSCADSDLQNTKENINTTLCLWLLFETQTSAVNKITSSLWHLKEEISKSSDGATVWLQAELHVFTSSEEGRIETVQSFSSLFSGFGPN